MPTKKPQKSYVTIIDDNNNLSVITRIRETIESWRKSLLQAENPYQPIRAGLIRLYKEVMDDNHLASIVNLRTSKLQRLSFDVVNNKGKVKNEYLYVFKSKWFYDLQKYYIESILYGHSLLQIDSITNYNIDSISLIPRQCVSPEKGLILTKSIYTLDGYDYRAPNPQNKFYIEIMDNKKDLGLLSKIAPNVLYKRFDMQFWSRFLEMYGVPYRIAKVASNDTESRDYMYKALLDMGSAGFMISNKLDDITTLDVPTATSVEFFKQMIDIVNSEVSKLIIGASGIVDGLQSGTQSQSNVHQSQFDVIAISDMVNFGYFVNNIIIPTLQHFDILPYGMKLNFHSPEEEYEKIKKLEMDLKVSDLVDKGYWDIDYLKEQYQFKPTTTFETDYKTDKKEDVITD